MIKMTIAHDVIFDDKQYAHCTRCERLSSIDSLSCVHVVSKMAVIAMVHRPYRKYQCASADCWMRCIVGYIWIKFGYQLDHNAPNSKLYARAPVFAKRSIAMTAIFWYNVHFPLSSTHRAREQDSCTSTPNDILHDSAARAKYTRTHDRQALNRSVLEIQFPHFESAVQSAGRGGEWLPQTNKIPPSS